MHPRNLIKGLIPAAVRQQLRARQYSHLFNRSLKEFRRDPRRWCFVGSPVIRDLIRGWHNEGWSATDEYLVACLQYALASPGPILECGSGLTTIVLGTVAASTNTTVWSLEHNVDWGERVANNLRRSRIESVQLCINPLKEFNGFTWYDPPLKSMPEFSLVICDGPPGDTPGGRYGLLPIMNERLKAGAIVLLDDAGRDQERLLAERWASEFKASYQMLGSETPYILLKMPPK